MKQARTWGWVIAVVILALVSNLVLVLLTSGKGKGTVFSPLPSLPSDALLSAVPLTGERAALLTLDNALIITEQEQEIQRVTLPFTAAGLVYLSDQGKLLAGAADGRIYVYDLELKPVGQTNLEKGLVTGMADMADDQVAVGTGIGAYGDRFYLSILDAQQQPLQTYQIGRPIEAIGALNDLALAGDENAWITAITTDGQLKWQTQLERNVTALCGDSENKELYAGDTVGNAYLLDEEGQVVWKANISQWKIEAIYPLQDMVLYGDTEGSLHLLDQTGQVLLSYLTTGERVTALYPTAEGNLVALYRNGKRVGVNLRALSGAQLTQTLRPVWVALNTLWVILLLITLTRAIASLRRAFHHVRQEISRSLLGYLFLLPTALAILIFTYLPSALAIYYSMTDFIPGKPTRFIGLTNFFLIFTQDKYFWVGMGNMLLILATSTIKVLTIPLLVALLIFHIRREKWQYIFRTAFIVPTVVPGIVSTLMWKMMYSPGDAGFFNNLLQLTGRPEWQRAWLGDEHTAIWAIIFAGFPWIGAFALLIYLGGLINVNPELVDAAAIDGVNAWQRLRYVEWPLLAPQRSLLLFFTYLGAIQGYAGIYVFTEGGPGYATYVPALQMFLRLSRGMEVGYASAIGLVLLVMVLAITIAKRQFEREESVA